MTRKTKNAELKLKLEFCKICHSEALFVPQGLSRSLKAFLIEGIAEESALPALEGKLRARHKSAGSASGGKNLLFKSSMLRQSLLLKKLLMVARAILQVKRFENS